jgi:hypothetical protein
MQTREEHLAWAKERALAYLPADPQQAFDSIVSDLGKHPETEGHRGLDLGMRLLLNGQMNDPEKMREWIAGFH